MISQKVVSKAEGQTRRLSSVIPGAEARKLAAVLGKEPALVELILEESNEVLRAERGVLIIETRHGFVCANAGIDSSNLPEDDTVCLLPEDPDASARRIRREIVGEESGWASPDKSGECPERPTPTPSRHRGRDRRQLRASVATGPGRGGDRLRRPAAAR